MIDKLPEINGWAIKKLRDLPKNQNDFVDGPFGSNLKVSDYTESGIRLIQLQNIEEGKFDDENKKYTSLKKSEQLKRHVAYPGDIAIAKMADPVGRACIIPDLEERYLVVADCIKLSVDKENYDPKFITYMINSFIIRKQALMRSTGSTRLRINLGELKKISIPVPPLIEQRGIVEVLGTVDECIRLTDAVIERAEELKRGLMQRLLTRGIGHTEYKETPLGIMPTKWKIMSLKEISTKGSQNGLYKSNNQGSPVKYVRMTELFKSDILTNELENTINVTKQEKEKFLLKNGDLLFGRRSFVVEGAGKCVLVYGLTSEAVFESSIIRFSLNDELIDPFFCLNWFLNNIGYREIRRIVRVVTVSGVTGKDLEKVKVPIPPLEEQKKISDIIKSVNKLISEEREKKHYLISVKTGLMQRLLPGTIRVELKGDGIQRIRDSREAYN